MELKTPYSITDSIILNKLIHNNETNLMFFIGNEMSNEEIDEVIKRINAYDSLIDFLKKVKARDTAGLAFEAEHLLNTLENA